MEKAKVGPFARVRPETVIGKRASVGNFVELKKATLGEGVKANHLSYLGDCEVGAFSNIGAGVITCNFDGVRKHRTKIAEHAFIGSDCQLVAPVEIGHHAYIGAGSTITRDVPARALAVRRAKLRSVLDWASPKASEDEREG
jgi:bifunctional UDP-N-acetylglucosamine pyrophosphorylase/glucosamine-1-phosphate N-acetyltransferase